MLQSMLLLFRHFLAKQLPARELVSPGRFADALSAVHASLHSLVYGQAANFLELRQAGDKLGEAGRLPDTELQLIANCPQLHDGASHNFDLGVRVAGLRSVLQLGQLARRTVRRWR